MASSDNILGAYEKVNFPKFDLVGLLAKIDTGADTGAFHATKIHEEKVDGQSILFFSPFDHPEFVESTTNFKKRVVKSSNGYSEMRYFIDTIIEIRGKQYPITLSLADRNKLKYPVLIGRSFLSIQKLLVDVTQNNL